MPELNAGLLQIGNLSDVLNNASQQNYNQKMGLINTLGQSAQQINQNLDANTVNDAISQNFDPKTKQVNQDAVIQTLYSKNPLLAQKYAAQMQANAQAQQVAQAGLLKTQSEAAKNMSDAQKTQQDAQTSHLNNTINSIKAGTQLLAGVNDQAGFDNAIKWAKSQGLNVAGYEGATFTPQLKTQIYAQLMDAKDTLQNQLDQFKAVNDVAVNKQNADTNRMNANTNLLKANQDYNINKENNQQGWAKVGISNREADIKQQLANQELPKIQIEQAKAQNELQDKQFKLTNENQAQLQKLDQMNGFNKNIVDTSKGILDKIIQVDQKGNYAKDNDGNYLIKKDNILNNAKQRATMLMVPGNNDYKEMDARIGTLIGQVTGKTQQDIKAIFGSQGPVTDADARTFAAMAGINSKDDFYKLDPQTQANIIGKISEKSAKDIEQNNANAERIKAQQNAISNQNLPFGNIPNQNYGVNVGAPLKMSYTQDGGFIDSRGNYISPEMQAQIKAKIGK